MTSPDERIEVAERLRELPTSVGETIAEWESEGLLIEADLHDEADYSQIHNVVLGCFPAEHMHPCDYEELHERLADLIDPTCEVVVDEPDGGADEFVAQMLGMVCSRCGGDMPRDRFTGAYPDYCPHCGARVVSHVEE